jgi:hypothetical protein
VNEGVAEFVSVERHVPRLSSHQHLPMAAVSGDFEWAKILK